MYLKINPKNPQPRHIERVVQILRQGGVVAYPTDTCYGLGCDIRNKKAIERVYQIKQLDRKQPFSFICSGLTNISQYAKVSNYAYKTMKRLLPGPYTFILDGSKLVPKMMLTKRKTAGIRVPNHPICLQIIEGLGNPIISTSITRQDHTMLNEPFLIEQYLGKRIDIIIDGGPVPGEPSSVISLIDDEPAVLREGLGPVDEFL
jgi:tRNA threonylcarbamoyl adenosine modification protein (Sua5/YciO/YrdC/YwlC family)